MFIGLFKFSFESTPKIKLTQHFLMPTSAFLYVLIFGLRKKKLFLCNWVTTDLVVSSIGNAPDVASSKICFVI